MSATYSCDLERMLRENDLDSMVDWYMTRDKAIPYLLNVLEQVNDESQKRFSGDGPRINQQILAEEYDRNPHKVLAFLQILGSCRSPQILLMVWRVLNGATIKTIQLQYTDSQSFELQIVLSSPDSASIDRYESNEIRDVGVLRHIGAVSVDGKPRFQSFYPLRLTRD